MKKFFTEKIKISRWVIVMLARMHFFGNPSKRLKIVGVTGTNGKTTTTTLLYKVATELGYKCGLIGTVENIIVDEVIPALRTTPSPVPLNRMLNEMADKGCEYAFMEVSSHGLDQGRVAGIKFAGGIFSNLTQDHLDYHKTMENYFQAKNKLFQMLPRRSFALANIDDAYGPKMLEGIEAHKFSYGFSDSPTSGVGLGHFQGEIVKMGFEGVELEFNDIPIHSKLQGKFNAYNLLAVWSTCSLLGFDMDKVNKILETIEPPRGRFEHFLTESGVLVVVDYAHTPDALQNIIRAVTEIKGENAKLISVFGCGGDRDATKRKVMGKIGAESSDVAIFTSDNPRSEDPEKIIQEMKEGLDSEELKKVKTISGRREAIQEAAKLAQKGDIILCAGKGHETYQEVKGIKTHFDDMEELKKAF